MDNFLYKYKKYCLSGGAKDTIYCVTSDYKLVEIAKIDDNQDIIYTEYVNKLAESDKKIHTLLCKITCVHCYTSDGDIYYKKYSYMKLREPTYLSNVYKDINYYAMYKRGKCNILVFITDNIWYVYIHTHINYEGSVLCINKDEQKFINNYILSTLINMGIKYKNAEENIMNISDTIYKCTKNLEEKYKSIKSLFTVYIKELPSSNFKKDIEFIEKNIYVRDLNFFFNINQIIENKDKILPDIVPIINKKYQKFINDTIKDNDFTISTKIVVNIDPDTSYYTKAYCCLIEKIDSCHIFVFFQYSKVGYRILLYVYSEENITKDSDTLNKINNFLSYSESSNKRYNENMIKIFNHILKINDDHMTKIKPELYINELPSSNFKKDIEFIEKNIYVRDLSFFFNINQIIENKDKILPNTVPIINKKYQKFINDTIKKNDFTISTKIVVNIFPGTPYYTKAYCCLIEKIDSCYIFVFFQYSKVGNRILLYVYSKENITKDSDTLNKINNFLSYSESSNKRYNENMIKIFNHILKINDDHINKIKPYLYLNELCEEHGSNINAINIGIDELKSHQTTYDEYKNTVYNDIPNKLLKLDDDKSELKLELNIANVE